MKCSRTRKGSEPSLNGREKRTPVSTKQITDRSVRSSRGRKGGFSPRLPWALVAVALFLLTGMQRTLSGTGRVDAYDESISTFASNCTDPKDSWNLGQTACAVATGAPDDRRIAWVAPNGAVAQISNFFSGSTNDSYSIPTGADPFAQVGTWTVETIDLSGAVFSVARFVVRDPNNAAADLSIANFGPFQTSAGGNLTYRIEFVNRGPDDAQNVTLTNPVPGNTTFVSEAQDTGPALNCTTPSPGSGTGSVNCTLATLPPNTLVVITLTFSVTAGTPNGTTIVDSVTASSDTSELNNADNSAAAASTVVSATSACTVSCPSVAPISTAQCSAVVTYAAPTTSGDCGTDPVVCSPPSGSTFPIGSTAVVCTAPSGDTCSFGVTVNYTGGATTLGITCPSDLVFNAEDVSAGTAVVNYPAPTATGACVTVVCAPPSGSTFLVGSTLVTCTATDAFQDSTSCSFNITVNNASAGGCTVICPSDVTEAATTGCSVVVNYPAAGTSGTCGTVTCNPASGSIFPVGSTSVTCSSPEGANCSFTVTVIAPAGPVITTCASDKTIPVVSNCEAPAPNLVSEVATSGCSVVVTQSPTPGTPLPVGANVITITAENSAGSVTCTATVTVVETFTGFFPPVDNLPTLNVVNAGKAVPVKFSLGGNLGLDIFEPGYPATVTIACDMSSPSNDIEETVTAGQSSLSFDSSNNQYTYVWKTDSSWVGTCRQLIIRLKNGCEHRANFKFR